VFEVAGPELTLRPPEEGDVPALFALGSDPEVTRWFSWGPYRGEAEPRAFVEEAARRREAGDALVLSILRDGELLGITELAEPSRRDRRAMVGTWLGRAHWGSGANAQSKALVLHLAFAEMGLERVGAYTNVDNVRSQRALERLGFRREGELRRWHRHGYAFHDVYVYGVLRDEWRPAEPATMRGSLPPAFVPDPG
jgi:ribosomal-protein-alanine N-acetyltransferase